MTTGKRKYDKRQAIDARQAKTEYLRLGPERSLNKLAAHYAAVVEGGLCLRSLKYWSVRDGWQKAAAQHDERVADRIAQKMEDEEVATRFDQLTVFSRIVENGTKMLEEFVDDPKSQHKIRNAAEFSAMANSLVRVAELIELIEGRPTGRIEEVKRLETPPWLRDRLPPPTIDVTPRPAPVKRHDDGQDGDHTIN